jgi:hypothetical protein
VRYRYCFYLFSHRIPKIFHYLGVNALWPGITLLISYLGRSQWHRNLKHELPPPAQTLGSWVRIPLKEWMSVCVYSMFVLFCVGSGLATGWSPVQGVLLTVYRIKKLKSGQGPTKGCRSIIIISYLGSSVGNCVKAAQSHFPSGAMCDVARRCLGTSWMSNPADVKN